MHADRRRSILVAVRWLHVTFELRNASAPDGTCTAERARERGPTFMRARRGGSILAYADVSWVHTSSRLDRSSGRFGEESTPSSIARGRSRRIRDALPSAHDQAVCATTMRAHDRPPLQSCGESVDTRTPRAASRHRDPTLPGLDPASVSQFDRRPGGSEVRGGDALRYLPASRRSRSHVHNCQ